MQNSLAHRGPDSQGIWVDDENGIALIHNRLAIQDLSQHGHQPMWSPSGRYCIVFNGEIYNFKKLASKLTELGCQFKGHSDTEVLLNAIEQWGLQKTLQSSIGMFAFALWDKQKSTISFCRDRLGEKPLYYGWLDDCFYFASELKAIEAITDIRNLDISSQGLSDFLKYGYISAPHTIYQNIFKLVPGTVLTLPLSAIFNNVDFSPFADTSAFGPKTYWSALTIANHGLNNQLSDEEEAIKTLDALLNDTVNMQTIADVNVGVFLSGGIDSSTVAAIAQHNSNDKIRTFSIGFDEKEYDESQHAQKIADHLGTDHSTINVSPQDALNIVSKLATIYDEPFADSSQIPMYIVSEFARSKVIVCLSGDGGDELFAGYNRYLSTDSMWEKFSVLPFVVRSFLGKLLALPTPGLWDKLYRLLKITNTKEKQKLVGLKLQKLAGLMQQTSLMQGYDYLLSYWHKPHDINALPNQSPAKIADRELPASDNFINSAMFLDQVHYLPGDNLTKVDRASMAVSLETRLPLLSHEVVELSWRIPVSMKARGTTSKWLLRQVLYRYVPKELIERPKMGFSVPVAQWLRNDLKGWAEQMLGLIGTPGYDFINKEPVYAQWKDHISGKRDNSQRLWTILMLLAWRRQRLQ